MNRFAAIMAMGTPVAAAPDTGLYANLISYWTLDEASGTRSDSRGTNHLTDNNSVGSTTGKISNAALFVSAGSKYLSRASNSTLEMSGNTDFTISAWINLTSLGGQSLITKDDDAANSRDFTLDYSGGLRFYIKGGGTYIVATGTGTNGVWYFVVAWYDSSNGQLHVRINDTTTWDSTTGATGTDASAAQFRIGAREYAANEDYANAAIDEVGLWKRLLTGSEITQLYNGGSGLAYPFPTSSSLLTGLTAYYALSSTSDASGGGNTLTNNGTVTFGTGKVGNAATFVSASSQYLSHADATAYQVGTGDFSYCAWIKYTSTNKVGFVFYGRNDLAPWFGLRAAAGGGGELVITLNDDIHGTAAAATSGAWNDGSWHFAVVTCSRAGNMVLYVDNSSVATVSISSQTATLNNSVGFTIGTATESGTLLDGSVDEVGLWTRVLTGTEITALWNSGAGTTYPF